MSASSTRRTSTKPKLASPSASKVRLLIAERNPTVARDHVESIARLVTAFTETAVKLSPAARLRLLTRKKLIHELVTEAATKPEEPQKLRLKPKGAVEVLEGTGVGETLSVAEGQARVDRYATPTPVEEWAGRLAGPTELERELGIARSTLHAWQKQGAVIGVQVGVRKHAFPVEQFIDGRPVQGIEPVVKAVGEIRTAWRWLREPNPELSGDTPLARLRDGFLEPVLGAARLAFGRG